MSSPSSGEPRTSTLALSELKVRHLEWWHLYVADSVGSFSPTLEADSPLRTLFKHLAATHEQYGRLEGDCAAPFALAFATHLERIPRPDPNDLLVRDGMIVHNALFADYLATLGEYGAQIAEALRQTARERLAEAVDEQSRSKIDPSAPPEGLNSPRLWWLWGVREDVGYPKWAKPFALALWSSPDGDDVREQAKTAQVLLHPALFRPMVERVALAPSSRLEEGRIVNDQGQEGWLVPAPGIDPLLVEKFHGLESFGTSLFDALLRWMAHEAHKLFIRNNNPALRMIIEVDGGTREIAHILGFRSKQAPTELRALLTTMTRTTVVLDHPGRFRSTVLLADFDEQGAAPGRRARVRLELSPLFAPQAVHSVPKGHPDRAVIPVLTTQPPLPTGIVNRNAKPAALALEWRALIELHARASDLVRHGGVELDWGKMAIDSGLPESTLPRLLESWTTGPSPRWVSHGTRWTLGPGYSDAIALLEQAGKQKKNGRNAARRRWNRRDKQTKLFD